MMKKKNIEILSGLFKETEQVSLSNEELNASLLEISLDPDRVVTNGLERIKKHIELKDSVSATTNNSMKIEQDFESLPLAAVNKGQNILKGMRKKKS